MFVVSLVWLNNKEFRFFLIGLNSIFSTLPQSEYTSREVYSGLCLFLSIVNLSIWCFNVVQPETRFHFQSANQIAKQKVKIFKKFQNFKNLQKISKFQKFTKNSKFKLKKKNLNFHKISKLKNFIRFQNFHPISKF
jgi:hypothetical protein